MAVLMSVNFPIHGSARMQPPICAICTPGDEYRIVLVQKGEGIRHWPYEGHKRDETPPVTKVCDEKKTGRPKKYASRAEQQKAYRRRHGIP